MDRVVAMLRTNNWAKELVVFNEVLSRRKTPLTDRATVLIINI